MSRTMFEFDSVQDSSVVAHEDLLIQLVGELRQRLGGRIRDVRLTQMADQLVLHGQANTYYAKQLAQTIVLELVEQVVLANEIVVL